MKKRGLTPVFHYIVLTAVALVVVLLGARFGGGLIDKGEKSVGGTESMAGSGVGSQCWTFCGGKRADTIDVQKNSKCIIFSCNADGKSHSYTCTEDSTNTKCLSTCNMDKQIPAACKPDCANIVSTKNCKDVLAEMEQGGYVGSGGGSGSSGGGSGGGGSGSGGSAGGSGGSGGTVLLQDGKIVTTPKYGVPTEVRIGTSPPKDFQITVKDSSGAAVPCDASGSKLCSYGSAPFIFWSNPPALKDGTYALNVDATAASGAKSAITNSISWACSLITIDPSTPFGPGKTMIAILESPVIDIDKVTVELNGKSSVISDKKIVAADPRKVSFKLPLVGALGSGVVEGKNTLRIERNNEGTCLRYNAATGADEIMNYMDKEYTWTCAANAPATGCYVSGGKDYIVSGKSSTGNYIDPLTGCRYSTLGAVCADGCIGGKCKEPTLFIDSVKLEGIKAGAGKYYEDYYADRFFTITVKNTGTFMAKDVLSGLTVTLGGKALAQFSDPTFTLPDPLIDIPGVSNNLVNLDVDQSAEYFFSLKKTCSDPVSLDECYQTKVLLSETSAKPTLSISAKPSNGKTTVGTVPLTFYSCSLNCPAFTDKSQALCEGTCGGCRWYAIPAPKCEAECGKHCGTDTKTECGKTCLLCKWDAVSNSCYKP